MKLERALDGPAPPSEGVQASLPFTSSRIAILAIWASAGTSVDLGNVSFLHFSGTERIAALFHITIAYSEISAHLSRGIVYFFLPTSKVEAILVCLQRKHMDESLVHHVILPARQFYSSQPLCWGLQKFKTVATGNISNVQGLPRCRFPNICVQQIDP